MPSETGLKYIAKREKENFEARVIRINKIARSCKNLGEMYLERIIWQQG
jgi:hypothetical protein